MTRLDGKSQKTFLLPTSLFHSVEYCNVSESSIWKHEMQNSIQYWNFVLLYLLVLIIFGENDAQKKVLAKNASLY